VETLLFTGASGFVGRNVVPQLRGRYRVVTLGRNPADDVVADLSHCVPELSECPQVVVHAAALAHPGRHTVPDDFMAVNVDGTRNLCKSLERGRFPRAFVFISTVAVYGVADGTSAIDEACELRGASAYARSKIEAERWLRLWCEANGVALAILRLSALIGRGAPGNVGRMVVGMRRGYYMGIGSGTGLRGMTLVDDLAPAIVAAIGRTGVWNIVGENMRMRGIEQMVADAVGRRFVPRIPDAVARVAARIGDCFGAEAAINTECYRLLTRSIEFSSARARAELGWHPAPIAPRLRLR